MRSARKQVQAIAAKTLLALWVSAVGATAQIPARIQKIEHVVWIIQENRTFDNYFGMYLGADGIPPGTCLPKLPGSQDCVKPFHLADIPACDLSHDWEIAHAAYDHGTMDGFVWAEGSPYAMSYLEHSDIPNYWTYAGHFVLADRFFSSLDGPSLPNHLFTVAAQSGGLTGNVGTFEQLTKEIDDPEGFSFASMADLFSKANITWKYYIETLSKPPGAEDRNNLRYPDPKQMSLWNPLPAFAKVRNDPTLMAHLVTLDEYALRQQKAPGILEQIKTAIEAAVLSALPGGDAGKCLRICAAHLAAADLFSPVPGVRTEQ